MNTVETANASLRVLLHVIFKRKNLIITFFVATLIVAGIFSIRSQPMFKASSEILIKMGREHLFVPTTTDSGLRALSSYTSLEQINSEIELISSRPIIEKVIETVGPTVIYADFIDKEPGIIGSFRKKISVLVNGLREKLTQLLTFNEEGIAGSSTGYHRALTDQEAAYLRVSQDLSVKAVKNSRIIEITFAHKDAQIASMVLKKLVDAYLEVRPHIHKNTESFAFFQEQSEILKKKLRQREDVLKAFKEANEIVALEEERTLLLRNKSELKAQLNESLSEKVETENRIKQIIEQLNSTPAKIQQGETTNLNPLLINTLEERLVNLELKEKELLTKYTENNQLVRQVKEELGIVRQKLAEQESKRYGSASIGPNPTFLNLKEQVNRNEAELEAIDGRIKSQRGQLDDYTVRLERLNQVEFKLSELESQLEVDQKNYQLYLTKYEENRISSEMDTKNLANVSVIKPAQPPLKPEGPKTLLILAIGLFVATFGSIGLALCLELLNDRLERPEDIESYLKTPVLASVSEFK
jgi:uncharacterized protein involved in exopolysaccharide biosynthesis